MKMESPNSIRESDRLRLGFVTLPVKTYTPPLAVFSAGEQAADKPERVRNDDAAIVETNSPAKDAESGNDTSLGVPPEPVPRIDPPDGPERPVTPADDPNSEAVKELKSRDREVRAHEQAHASVLGPYKTSSPQYFYAIGPDGQRYAVGGEVGVDLSPEADPEETIRKMQTIKRAALAPVNPSSADRAVVARAAAFEAQAKIQLNQEEIEAKQQGQAGQTAQSEGLSATEELQARIEEVQEEKGGLLSITA